MLALTMMVGGASPAAAGGPTSVLVTSPGSEQATAMYYSDADYGRLEQLLGPPQSGTRAKPPEAELAGAPQINVTWMVHDMSPWRLDRVFLTEARDQVWIHTTMNLPDSSNGVWHRGGQPALLRALLKRLGLTAKATGTGYTGIPPAPWQSGTASDTTDRTTQATASRADAVADRGIEWWWAIPGAAAGAALSLTLRPLVSRSRAGLREWRREREQGPRQELRDV